MVEDKIHIGEAFFVDLDCPCLNLTETDASLWDHREAAMYACDLQRRTGVSR